MTTIINASSLPTIIDATTGAAVVIDMGDNAPEAARQADRSAAAADRSELSAAAAESLVGPTYASTAAGLAATAEGGSFAVNVSGAVAIYRKVSGAAVEQRTLATTAYAEATYTKVADLASTASGKGSALVRYRSGPFLETKLKAEGPNIDDWTSGTVLERLNAALAGAASSDAKVVHLNSGLFTIPSDELAAEPGHILRPPGVALIGAGRELTTLQLTGSSVTNALFRSENASNILTKGMTIIGNGVTDEGAPYANAMMSVYLFGNSEPGFAAATQDASGIIFEDCDIENFGSAAWFMIQNRGSSYTLSRCGSRRCNWTSRTGNSPWPGRITVPGHFVYFDGIAGPIADPVLGDFVMDARYIKGGVAFVGDVSGPALMRVQSIRNAGLQNHTSDPTWALSDTQNALDGNPAGHGRGDYAAFFYKSGLNPNGPRDLTLEVEDMANCVGSHVYDNLGEGNTVRIGRASGMADTQNTSLKKAVFALNGAKNFTGSVDSVKNCMRVVDISMDSGNDMGTARANAGIRLHLGFVESMSGAFDIKIDLGATAWAGGVTITGERSGPARYGVILAASSTFGLQDIDLSSFKNNGAQDGEGWGEAAASVKMRRIRSSGQLSGTSHAIIGHGGGSANTSQLYVSDWTLDPADVSLTGYAGVAYAS